MDDEQSWRIILTHSIQDLSKSVGELREWISGAKVDREDHERRILRLENGGSGVRGWLMLAITATMGLITIGCSAGGLAVSVAALLYTLATHGSK